MESLAIVILSIQDDPPLEAKAALMYKTQELCLSQFLSHWNKSKRRSVREKRLE